MTPTLKLTPFRKILIANRGEISLRIIRTAQAMGYRTVAVYSIADAAARHVRAADEAVCVGGALPAESYLNIPAIMQAVAVSGADAVHPGYGFLAENEDFAAACVGAGVVFIGPSPRSILSMGNKAGAKDIMIAAGVPCVPGYQGEDQSENRMLSEARQIGFPLMIKATAGGGGRGMRLVRSAAEFPELLRGARSEALHAFGDSNVILERAIISPRHIEIQILADRYGNAVHLGERDCSVQRRHQKVIEETPSPALNDALRAAMGSTAVNAVKAMGYEGAGTLEFLLDASGDFYFMEMNTRLQVEHPVTELVTGLDLVEQQLRIAAGEPLSIIQSAITARGHAIEVRLCAEDPEQEFLPQSGTMGEWMMPAGLRVEDSLYPGAVVSPFYDSMMAKLVSHGQTREDARRKLIAGLENAVALGVVTNQHFLIQCLSHPVFAGGGATTAFIGDHRAALLAIDTTLQDRMIVLGAALLCGLTAPAPDAGLIRPIMLLVRVAGRSSVVVAEPGADGRCAIRIDDALHSINIVEFDGCRVRYVCDGLGGWAAYLRDGATLSVQVAGKVLQITDVTLAATSRTGEQSDDEKIRAFMSGRVVEIMIAVGDRVTAGQPLLIIEAMKMEHLHAAPSDGSVLAIHASKGDHVTARTLLLELGDEGAGEATK